MKTIFSLILNVLLLLSWGYCHGRVSDASKYQEPDTAFVVCDGTDIPFRCVYESSLHGDYKWFTITSGDYMAKIVFSYDAGGDYSLESIKLGECVAADRSSTLSEKICKVYKCYFFGGSTLHIIFSDVRNTGESAIMEEEGSTKPQEFWKYSYTVCQYSVEDYQMTKSGKEYGWFYKSFDFERGQGCPYGKWLEFKRPVLTDYRYIQNRHAYRFGDIPADFQYARNIVGRPLRWSLTDSGFILSFSPKDGKTYCLEIKTDSKMSLSHVVQKDHDGDRLIEHSFAQNGNIASLAIRNQARVELYNYDSDKGFLKTVRILTPGTHCLEETFDADNEYETVDYNTGLD